MVEIFFVKLFVEIGTFFSEKILFHIFLFCFVFEIATNE